MSRNTHDRALDHHNSDLDTNIVLDGATTNYSSAAVLHTVISDIDDRIDSNATASGVLNFILDGGGAAIPSSSEGWVELNFAGTWVYNRLFADQTGSIVVDLWKDSYANFPPTVADTITASAKPTLSSASKNEDTTLTGWTTAFSKGDILKFHVDSATTVTKVTLSLGFRRS
jgi:hypothetical protein